MTDNHLHRAIASVRRTVVGHVRKYGSRGTTASLKLNNALNEILVRYSVLILNEERESLALDCFGIEPRDMPWAQSERDRVAIGKTQLAISRAIRAHREPQWESDPKYHSTWDLKCTAPASECTLDAPNG